MTLVVVDASVVLKWFGPEIHSDAAQRLLSPSHHLLAPDLLFCEVGNAIWKKVRRGELTAEDGRALARDVTKVAVETVGSRELMAEAVAVAVHTGITVYDAMYLTLAVRLETVLVTADDRLAHTVAAHPAAAPHVRLVQTL